jgi:hypothetical protein
MEIVLDEVLNKRRGRRVLLAGGGEECVVRGRVEINAKALGPCGSGGLLPS